MSRQAACLACRLTRLRGQLSTPHKLQRRAIQISASQQPSSSNRNLPSDVADGKSVRSPDATFEVIGSPYSLLSVSLSASQSLHTRRGTLVAATGKLENAQSTMSSLEPFRRSVLGIPFLYQKVSSTTPITALISTKTATTSFTVVHLNGTVDWMICQRNALLAWTGQSLSIRPTINRRMSIAHWGNSQVTGRGLLALTGTGNICEIKLDEGEGYIAHPSNVVAYTMSAQQPLPYRLKSSSLRLQIPSIKWSRLLPDTRFVRVMGDSSFWKYLTSMLFTLRTWSRRTIWGDRLFLQFVGPTTILLQTRASRISDILTSGDINEIADSPAGAVSKTLDRSSTSQATTTSVASIGQPTKMTYASIDKDGKVRMDTDTEEEKVAKQ